MQQKTSVTQSETREPMKPELLFNPRSGYLSVHAVSTEDVAISFTLTYPI